MLLDREIQIGPAEWDLWLRHPVTEAFMTALQYEREEWVQRLSLGDTLAGDRSVELTARAVGAIYGLDVALSGMSEVLTEQWKEAQERKESESEAV